MKYMMLLMLCHREPEQHLIMPDSSDLFGLLTDDESDNDIPPLIKTGTSQSNTQLKVTADIHKTVQVQKTTSSIEADPELMDDEEDDYIFNLKDRCTEVDLVINTKGYERAQSKILDIIPKLYRVGLNVQNSPSLENYLKQVVGTLPTDSFLCNALDYVFGDYPHLNTIQEDVYEIIKLLLAETNHLMLINFRIFLCMIVVFQVIDM